MTRKDFILIADVFKNNLPDNPEEIDYFSKLLNAMSDALEKTNDRFNPHTFESYIFKK